MQRVDWQMRNKEAAVRISECCMDIPTGHATIAFI
jgi:hypothetical protein